MDRWDSTGDLIMLSLWQPDIVQTDWQGVAQELLGYIIGRGKAEGWPDDIRSHVEVVMARHTRTLMEVD